MLAFFNLLTCSSLISIFSPFGFVAEGKSLNVILGSGNLGVFSGRAVFDILLSASLLVSALSIDALAASFGYGASKIKIPFLSAMIIALVSSLILFAALLAGSFIGRFLPVSITKGICCGALLSMGIIKLSDSLIKGYIRKHQRLEKNIKFNFLSLHFILKIYADPENADNDRSKTLSVKESISLAFALSLDSLVVGVGAGFMRSNFIVICALSLIFNLATIYLGSFLGRKIATKSKLNLSWISGAILIGLAVLKLIG